MVSHIHEVVFINSGSKPCSIIAKDNSNNSGVLIPFLFFAFSFVRVLAVCFALLYFVKVNNILT